MIKNLLAAVICMSFASGVLPSFAADGDPSKPATFLSPFKREAVSICLKPGWTVANKLVRDNMYLLQFVPPGTDLKNPQTLVNVVTYTGLQGKINARMFAKNEQSKAPELARPGKIDFKFVSDTEPNDVIYSIALSGNPKFPDQFEIHRVISGKDGIHTIIYHTQPATQTEAQVAEMLGVVRAVKMVEAPKQVDEASKGTGAGK